MFRRPLPVGPPATSSSAMSNLEAATPVPSWWLYGQMGPSGRSAETSPSGYPESPTLAFLPPPPPPGYYYPQLPPSHPIISQLDPGFLAEVDRRRSCSLVQFLKDERAAPTPEDDKKREKVIQELKKIVSHWWVKEVAHDQNVPQRTTTATLVTYGSYTLGAHGPESDIDALCAGPCTSTLEYHFFVVLRQHLEGRPEVSEMQTIENVKVPLMRFKFNGIAVDLAYAQLPAIDAAKAINTLDSQMLQKLDPRSWKSLSGIRVNERIVQLVPNAENFQVLLRCLKLWARKRGIYCNQLGFFAGIHLAILAAYVCRKYPNASVNGLFTAFFQTFAHWSWNVPVRLHDQPTNCLHSDGRLMPIVMPCTPPEFCLSNVTKSTFKKIKDELLRGSAIIMDQLRHDFQWSQLFEPFPYAAKYHQFLRIALCAPTSVELRDWAGWVKCRFRILILKLEDIGVECDPCPLEDIDRSVNKPNIVYYWGLNPRAIIHLDTYSLREDFMKNIITGVYGMVKCTQSELEVSVVGPPELPKSMRSHPVYWQSMPHCMLAYPYQSAECNQLAAEM